MKTATKFAILGAACFFTLFLAISIGSVTISFSELLTVFFHKLFGTALPQGWEPNTTAIIWNIRLPRALAAFAAGAALSVSGVVFQSVLGNPLASSYTLGVSSGASLGAAFAMFTGLSLLGVFVLPLFGFVFGLTTVFLAISFASKIDKGLKNNTIILVGMVFSLFVNALLTLLNALNRQYMQQLLLWQMGSFASKNYTEVAIMWAAAVLGPLFLLRFAREMDIITFGDEQSRALGVNTGRVKMGLLVVASLITGTVTCFTGTIGFVDLIAPHIVRRWFGPAHKYLVPASALFGGAFLALADTVARTALAPIDLPVGAVTALVGAPFFAFIYFGKSRGTLSHKGGRRNAGM